ncbi:MAG: sensor histidine kinase, partial [Maribacter sp.]
MPEFMIDQERLQNQTKLFLRVNYITSVGAILFGLICLFLLHITEIIPFALFAFGVLNLANLVLFAKHKKIMATYGISSVLALIASFVVTLYSGGIQSSFIFMIALVAFGGYATNRKFGVLYLNITFVLILLVFSQSFTDVKVTKNVVPEATAYIFDALSVL